MSPLADEHRRPVRRAALTIAVTIALVVGSVAIAATVSDSVRGRIGVYGTSKAPTASGLSPRKHLTLSAKVLNGPLVPGVKRPLRVTVKNPLRRQVAITSVTATAGKPKAAGCSPKWVKTTSFKATKKIKAIKVKPKGKAKVTLTITLKNLRSTNQDACKSTQFPLKLRATARQT
jgi:hypothetical protein